MCPCSVSVSTIVKRKITVSVSLKSPQGCRPVCTCQHILHAKSSLFFLFLFPPQAVSLGEQRGFLVEQFARIVRCYLKDSEDAFRYAGGTREAGRKPWLSLEMADNGSDSDEIGFKEANTGVSATPELCTQDT